MEHFEFFIDKIDDAIGAVNSIGGRRWLPFVVLFRSALVETTAKYRGFFELPKGSKKEVNRYLAIKFEVDFVRYLKDNSSDRILKILRRIKNLSIEYHLNRTLDGAVDDEFKKFYTEKLILTRLFSPDHWEPVVLLSVAEGEMSPEAYISLIHPEFING